MRLVFRGQAPLVPRCVTACAPCAMAGHVRTSQRRIDGRVECCRHDGKSAASDVGQMI